VEHVNEATMNRHAPVLDIDLNLPPEQRWQELRPWKGTVQPLLHDMVSEFEQLGLDESLVAPYAQSLIEEELLLELQGLTEILEVPLHRLLLANLYVDVLKLLLSPSMLGCTAFAAMTERGPILARNLDWSSEHRRLATQTIVVRFRYGTGPVLFQTVTWPGFVGCLSGVAPGRFALSYNAVLSDDAWQPACPTSMLFRQWLQTLTSFDQAKQAMCSTPLMSDGLFMLVGTQPEEWLVIERTPAQFAIRYPQNKPLVATNHYQLLTNSGTSTSNELGTSSCSRFDTAHQSLCAAPPCNTEDAIQLLKDPDVRMDIAMQHMVFTVVSGEVRCEIAEPLPAS
jgi:acid ceramidase